TIYVVNSTSNSSSPPIGTVTLPSAVAQANTDPNAAGSIIEFDPTVFVPGTSSTIDLQATLILAETAGPEVIEGPGASVVSVSGSGHVGVFQVNSGTSATLNGLTITDGVAGQGGGVKNAGTLSIDLCILSQNVAGLGGAIRNTGNMSITNSTLINNST